MRHLLISLAFLCVSPALAQDTNPCRQPSQLNRIAAGLAWGNPVIADLLATRRCQLALERAAAAESLRQVQEHQARASRPHAQPHRQPEPAIPKGPRTILVQKP